MLRPLLTLASAAALASCSSLPTPGPLSGGTDQKALSILRASAKRQGDPWQRNHKVKVAYEGQWSPLATRLQPVLTDPGFRKSSVEIYQPATGKIRQVHQGPMGIKVVERQRPRARVTRNGIPDRDTEAIDSAALVADAYTAFLFGPSWIKSNGTDFRLIGERTLDGEPCHLIAGRLSPGFGHSGEDHFIAWIGEKSRFMKRFQFTLNGLDSTRGADVDVVFSNHWCAPDGSIWPLHFVEHIQRPILAKAHEWRTTALTINGRACSLPGDGSP